MSAPAEGRGDGHQIEIRDLRKSFGDLEVLKGIDFSVDAGEVVCVIGPSGSGKSTLLRCVNLLEVPTAGQVFVDGIELRIRTSTSTPCGGASGWCSSSSTSFRTSRWSRT